MNETGAEGWVPAGATKTVNHSVGIDEAGTHELLVRVRLVSSTDGVRTVERTAPVTVRQPHPVLGMKFATTVAGSPTNATVRVANGLDAPVRNVELRLDPKTTFRPRSHSFATVGAGAERSVSIGVSGETNGSEAVRATLSCDYNGTRYTTTQRLTGEFVQPTNPGRVTLTNLDVEPAGDSLRIRGTASNPGGSNVTGVTVSVRDSETVRPGANGSDFFVGRIGPSDFGTFETQATPGANGTVTVRIHVSYVVDGVERETVRRVTYTRPANDEGTDGSSGGLPVELLGGAAVLLAGGAVSVGGERYRILVVLAENEGSRVFGTDGAVVVPEAQHPSDGYHGLFVETESFDAAFEERDRLPGRVAPRVSGAAAYRAPPHPRTSFVRLASEWAE